MAGAVPAQYPRGMHLEPGALVADRYRVEGFLARGGGSSVYRATDVKFELGVALKVATVSGQAYELFRARFQREARIGALLGRSEGLVRAIDWGELVPGHTLYMVQDLIADGQPLDLGVGSRAERLSALAAAAGLVERVHAQGVVHRDVKPHNFLVTPDRRLFLTDFGEAKPLRGSQEVPLVETRLTRTGAAVGTPVFMAPEQFDDARGVDPRADVYSLGVMLYLALTGRFPYDEPGPLQLMCALLQVREGRRAPAPSPRELDPTVDPGLDRLCREALALDPERRLASAGALAAGLRKARRPASGAQLAGARRQVAPTPSPLQRPSTDQGASLRQRLGLDEDGFLSREALVERLAERVDALEDATALVVRDERPVEGRTSYLGRVGFLLPRAGAGDEVTVGRTEASDLCIRLVTMSTAHAVFRRTPSGWTLTDLGSTNGTWVEGERLPPNEPRTLTSGERVTFAEHLTLALCSAERLRAELSQASAAAPDADRRG